MHTPMQRKYATGVRIGGARVGKVFPTRLLYNSKKEEIIMTELQELLDAINAEIYGVWFLIGAALVFWMQAGFAMVEAGFTRAKIQGISS